MIDLKNITFEYPASGERAARRVLNNLDFHFESGDRVGLLGPNGCGKTTLLHTIMGLKKPTSGTVEIFGKPRVKEEDFMEVRRRIGFVFQDANDQLFCPTVAEDIAFGPLNLGKSTHEAMHIVEHTLERVGLSGFEDRITYKLSGGEKRLVSLATVLAMEPEALLLDEPAAGLDEKTTARLVKILNESNLSFLVISHQRDFMQKVAHTFITMKKGRIEKS